jgi:acetoacetate decarboxylase
MPVRYGPKSPEELRNRELEATTIDSWASVLSAVYETDPDALAAVLPPPLSPPPEPLVRIAIASVDLGRNYPPFGAGTFAVNAMHGDRLGAYPLVMPMTTEQAVIGGRETYGEPKKLARVEVNVDGDQVNGFFERMGVRFVDLGGTIGADLDPGSETSRVDFYFKFLNDPNGTGFDAPPSLVYCHRIEKTRWVKAVAGEVTLREAPLDPVADLPVVRLRSIEFGERSTRQRGEIVGVVDGAALRPYVHQRYDDFSVLGKPD